MHIGDYWIHIVSSLQLAHYPTIVTESTAAEWSVCTTIKLQDYGKVEVLRDSDSE
ncbi:hypothetical protein HMPREF9010_03063 [Bacteroides sp. 3_1_23]|nr:hypothetical protein HMPREF9010_03063 [Bacteroides sp. 3_1_23]